MQDTPAPSFVADLSARERPVVHGRASAHLARGLRVDPRPAQMTRATL